MKRSIAEPSYKRLLSENFSTPLFDSPFSTNEAKASSEHVEKLDHFVKNEIQPHVGNASENIEPSMDATEMFQKIASAWKSFVGKGIKKPQYEKLMRDLLNVRKEWHNNPSGPNKLYGITHYTEQSALSGVATHWLLASQVGSATPYDLQPRSRYQFDSYDFNNLVGEVLSEAVKLKNSLSKTIKDGRMPEFLEKINSTYRNEIAPNSNPTYEDIPDDQLEYHEDETGARQPKQRQRFTQPKFTPDETYNKIVETWKDAVDHGLSQEQFDKFVGVLDGIRQQWKENPEGPHKFGSDKYDFEQTHLASFPSQWLTAFQVGSAGRFDRKASHGSHDDVWNSRDTGATAAAGPGEKTAKKGGKGGSASQAGDKSIEGVPGSSGQVLNTTMGQIKNPQTRRGPVTPKSLRGGTNEGAISIDNIAKLVTEDVNDTWY